MGIKLFSAIILFSLVLVPVKLNAHELAEDNSVAAVLHIDPEDKPIADVEQKLVLNFKDSENTFNLENCDCKLSIFEGSSLIDTLEIKHIASTISANSYTFENSGEYYIKLIGKSKNDSFDPFEIDYEVNVIEGQNSNFFSNKHILGLIGANILILILAFKFYDKLNRYK